MRFSRHIARRITLLGVVFALASGPAAANPFAPGEIKEIESFGVPGTVIDDPLRPFRIDSSDGQFIAGNVQDRVIDYDDGLLGFVSYLRDITGSEGAVIESFSRASFSDPIDVTWSPTSLGVVDPSLGFRSADGSTMTFYFSPGIPLSPAGILGGNEHITIRTNATEYAAVGEMFIGARAATSEWVK